MKPKDEFQSFINDVSQIKNQSYEEFIRLKCIVDGMLLAKKISKNKQ